MAVPTLYPDRVLPWPIPWGAVALRDHTIPRGDRRPRSAVANLYVRHIYRSLAWQT